MNRDFNRNGYTLLKDALRFEPIEINEIETYITKSKNENFGEGGILKILDWKNTEISKRILDKVIRAINENLNFDIDELSNKFTKKVYYTEDSIHTTNRNQLVHFDSYPKLKAFIYLSDNSQPGSGSIGFANGSHKSWFMKFVKFLRIFYVPGKYGVQDILFYNYFIKNLSIKEANGKKYSLIIFNTDTLHRAGKVEIENFKRKTVRFDFKLYEYPKSILKG